MEFMIFKEALGRVWGQYEKEGCKVECENNRIALIDARGSEFIAFTFDNELGNLIDIIAD